MIVVSAVMTYRSPVGAGYSDVGVTVGPVFHAPGQHPPAPSGPPGVSGAVIRQPVGPGLAETTCMPADTATVVAATPMNTVTFVGMVDPRSGALLAARRLAHCAGPQPASAAQLRRKWPPSMAFCQSVATAGSSPCGRSGSGLA